MLNEIEIKGKNLEDALNIAQNELKTSKDNISYEIIEETNKTLFSILSPKYIVIKAKVINTEKVEKNNNINNERIIRKIEISENEKEEIKKIVTEFLNNLFNSLKIDYNYTIDFETNILQVSINSKDAKILIGYRGEVLDALQTITTLVVNNKMGANIRIQLDVENYREKRKKILIDLANKVAQSVIKTGKSITLEPMVAFERKIIHLALQENEKIETLSVGEEPNRKVVIKLK